MKADRITRVNELIRRELGVQLYRIVNRPDLDAAAVTFTHALTSVDLRSCRVLVSIRGEPAEQERMLAVLKRHRVEFQEAVHRNVVLRYTPQLHFVLDHSVEEGDHVEARRVPAERSRAGPRRPRGGRTAASRSCAALDR